MALVAVIPLYLYTLCPYTIIYVEQKIYQD